MYVCKIIFVLVSIRKWYRGYHWSVVLRQETCQIYSSRQYVICLARKLALESGRRTISTMIAEFAHPSETMHTVQYTYSETVTDLRAPTYSTPRAISFPRLISSLTLLATVDDHLILTHGHTITERCFLQHKISTEITFQRKLRLLYTLCNVMQCHATQILLWKLTTYLYMHVCLYVCKIIFVLVSIRKWYRGYHWSVVQRQETCQIYSSRQYVICLARKLALEGEVQYQRWFAKKNSIGVDAAATTSTNATYSCEDPVQ